LKKRKRKHPEKALSAVKIRNAKPGLHADGGGLYLVCDDSGAKRWTLRTTITGKRHWLGLGGLTLVSLAEAREEAQRLRKIAWTGGDPLAERRKERRIIPTFEAAAREYHADPLRNFKNEKHRDQWINTLVVYAFPVIGNRTVDTIKSDDILNVISPIWNDKRETARRVRQRMRSVLDWCIVKQYIVGNNPVEGISKFLKGGTPDPKNHPALKHSDLPAFIEQLREKGGAASAKLAFEFLILTAMRTSEVLFAEWTEIDFDSQAWTVPAERMKMDREHRVPLSRRCLEILAEAKELGDGGEYIFPGRPRKPMSTMVFLMALRRMEHTDITPHGFRSTFRDWAEEKTKFKGSVIEAALAHKVVDKVERAYRRTDLFDLRIPLMAAWSAFATAKPAIKVVSIGREA